MGRNLLQEMAYLNKYDDDSSPLPHDKYRVWVQGSSTPTLPNIHIKSPQDGWVISLYLNTESPLEVIKLGNRNNADSFSDIPKLVSKWFEMPTLMPGRIGTNKDAAFHEWETCNC